MSFQDVYNDGIKAGWIDPDEIFDDLGVHAEFEKQEGETVLLFGGESYPINREFADMIGIEIMDMTDDFNNPFYFLGVKKENEKFYAFLMGERDDGRKWDNTHLYRVEIDDSDHILLRSLDSNENQESELSRLTKWVEKQISG